MITLLAKLFIKDYKQTDLPKVRQAYGMLCGIVGIGWNLLLFLGKIIAGTLASSIAITADAFNNLSDAGSAVITLFGFKLSGQKPDPEHPFGHGRMEYISGLLVSVVILSFGLDLAKTSFEKILHPQPVEFSHLTFFILIASILVKLYMAFYNFRVAKLLHSATMKATGIDSLNDCISTSAVLLSGLLSMHFGWMIDGYCGLAVAIFILVAGINAAKETINPLLGQPPSKQLVSQIDQIMKSEPLVLGIHDLVVHDYGPGRLMISLHAEVDANGNLLVVHEAIDRLEQQLAEQLGCHAVIHMDPLEIQNQQRNFFRQLIIELLGEISPDLTMHDFRMVSGPTETNLIFHVVLPYEFPLSESQLKSMLTKRVQETHPHCVLMINVDRDFLS